MDQPPPFLYDLPRKDQQRLLRLIDDVRSRFKHPHLGPPPLFLFELPREDQLLLLRLIDDMRFPFKHPHRGIEPRRPQISEEKRDACMIALVHHGLRHYNANNMGAEFDPVKPLMATWVSFRRALWVHVIFLAQRRNTSTANASPPSGDSNVKKGSRKRSSRRRNKVGSSPPEADTHVKHFFAELHYDLFYTPDVETCTIVEKSPCGFKTRCAFCPGSFEIFHPSDGKFVCGKKGQEKESFRLMTLLEKPLTCSSR